MWKGYTLEFLFLFLSVFSGCFIPSLYGFRLIRDFSFDNLLPKHDLYFIDSIEKLSQTDCALHCFMQKSKCNGIMYNTNLQSCKLMRCHLNEKSVKRNKVASRWTFWFRNDVCQPGWVPFENHCYFLNKTKDTWANAKKHCEQNEAHLLEIETEIENTWAMEAFLYPQKPGVCNYMCSCSRWIGATDFDIEGTFTWNGNTKINYSNWHPGQPENGRNGNCVQLCPNGLWDDTSCGWNKPFICEKE